MAAAMSKPIPDADHIVRYVPWNLLVKDDDDEAIIGVFPQAFNLRASEEYLSVTWVEHFSAQTICDRLTEAIKAFRKTMNTGAKSRFLMGNVGVVHRVCRHQNARVRILHEPDENPGHVAIRQYPKDDFALMSQLATYAFGSHINNRDVP